MPEKPTADERDWLLARLADLASEGGFERLVSAPLIEPSEAWFPDRWSPTRAGVEVLLRRLLFHAGLRDLTIEIDDVRDQVPLPPGLPYSEIDYVGHGAGVVRFELHRLGADDLLGILCHEVGKAYLDVLGLGRGVDGPYRGDGGAPDPDGGAVRDAQLGSIAAVYLGLGVPAANAAQSARARGEVRGNSVVTQWMITTAGGLPAQALAYLLAVQHVVRGREAAAYDALLPNQRADFEDWCDALTDSRDELVRVLRLPPEREWPQVSTSLTLVPFDYVDSADPPLVQTRDFNRGQRVYRVRKRMTTTGATLGLLAGMAAAIPIVVAGMKPLAFGMALALTALGVVIGRRWRRHVCSDPACEERIPPEARTCPRCAGTIVGELGHADERLEADERRRLSAGQAQGERARQQELAVEPVEDEEGGRVEPEGERSDDP